MVQEYKFEFDTKINVKLISDKYISRSTKVNIAEIDERIIDIKKVDKQLSVVYGTL